jgi:hypothetical protein
MKFSFRSGWPVCGSVETYALAMCALKRERNAFAEGRLIGTMRSRSGFVSVSIDERIP